MTTKLTSKYILKDTDLFLDAHNSDYVLRVRDLPQESKPREKMIKQGPEALSLPELLAVVLNTGNKHEDIMEMSRRIMREYGEKSILSEKSAKNYQNKYIFHLVRRAR